MFRFYHHCELNAGICLTSARSFVIILLVISMVLTFDIGNSNIVFAGVEDGRTVFSGSLSTETTRTADEYAVLLELMARQRNIDLHTAEGAIIASVVPSLTSLLRQALYVASGRHALVVGPGVKTGLNIRIEDISELGGDLVAAAVAALDHYPMPCVTIDMSMATAFGVLDKQGNYIGGAIAPGVLLSHNALLRSASKLPSISPDAPKSVIGRTTEDAVHSGVILGAAAQLDGMLERIENELGARPSVVATGEYAGTVVPHCKRGDIVIDPELTMRGLWLIYQKNVK